MPIDHDATKKRPHPAGGEVVLAEVLPEEPSPTERMAESRWQVLVMLFLALGPLALPLLFRSPRFSRLGKVVLTFLVGVQTVLVVLLVWWFAAWCVGELGKYQ